MPPAVAVWPCIASVFSVQMGAVQSIRCGRRILVNLDSLAAYLNGTDTPAAAEAEGVRRVN